MAEIPEHLLKRAQAAREKAEAEQPTDNQPPSEPTESDTAVAVIEEEIIEVDEKAEETLNTIITIQAKVLSYHMAQQRPMDTSIEVKQNKLRSSSMMSWIAHFLTGYPLLTGCLHPMDENLMLNKILNPNKTRPSPNKWNGVTQEEMLDSNLYVASIQFLMA